MKNLTQFFFSLLFFLSPSFFFTGMVIAQNTTISVNVGVVLDLGTAVGNTGLSCISMALSDFYASHGHYKTRLVLNPRDSKRDVVGAAAAGSWNKVVVFQGSPKNTFLRRAILQEDMNKPNKYYQRYFQHTPLDATKRHLCFSKPVYQIIDLSHCVADFHFPNTSHQRLDSIKFKLYFHILIPHLTQEMATKESDSWRKGELEFHYKSCCFCVRMLKHLSVLDHSTLVYCGGSALDLIKNVEVHTIIGPELSMQADFIIDLGDKAHVPVISFSATSTSLSPIRSPYFVRATHNDSSQVKAISAIIQTFGWREAVPIYVDNKYGEGIIPVLTDALQKIDIRVPYQSVIPPHATDDKIGQELYKLMTMQTRVFIVHMLPPLGSRLFLKAKEVGMMSEGYVWIVTDGIGNLLGSMNPKVIDSMQGVLGVESYAPQTKELEDFSTRWTTKFHQDNPTIPDTKLNIYGLWAHDAALALAMAVEEIGATSFGFQKTNISENSTDLTTFGVSQIGPKLCQALSNITFKGLAGDFHLVDRQLQSSAFQIVNVIGKGGRGIGFWTPKYGIGRKLKITNTSVYSTSKANLGVIIWPGETTSVPRGWVIPTSGKKLKIGVPRKDGFNEFVNVTRDPTTNVTSVTGFCIDVFKAVMDSLPYSVPYDFFPFEKPNGKSAGTYDELIYQVYLRKYDAVVGDTTIIANRSSYVDFTLPYTESGVSMIVPIKDNKKKNAWVFLKPLTWDLWVASACFFVFIGFVIWVLEHQINGDFRGPPSHQIGMIFWFSFSTMVFAHGEKVAGNLARFVVIIWVFVVLILTQSYTASLTSMLTVENLQPTFTDVNQLIKSGEHVGYLKDSFVSELLKEMKFDKSKLRIYKSPEECDDFLSKGSANGGIAAAFDEIPYIRLFLGKHGSKYTMVGPRYKTDGFGFVFPIGSPLVHDVSRAILKVTEGDKMVQIEKAWFNQQTIGPETTTSGSPNSLGLDSFWGLFLIVTVASSLALVIFTAMFLYKHKDVLMRPNASLRWKVEEMARRFNRKDLSFHAFRKSDQPQDQSVTIAKATVAVEASPNANCPPSPSSFSNHTYTGFGFSGETRNTLCREWQSESK